jgi:hypothetical protein
MILISHAQVSFVIFKLNTVANMQDRLVTKKRNLKITLFQIAHSKIFDIDTQFHKCRLTVNYSNMSMQTSTIIC